MEHLVEFFLHALEDTLPLLPWILLIYIVVELIENKTDLKKANRLGGKWGPLIGSATGLIPQCGFSIMAAKLYEQKYITIGTLLAIFFATSDEAFIIMLSSGEGAAWVLPTLAVKIALAIGVGYAVDYALKLVGRRQVCAEIVENPQTQPMTTKEIFIRAYLAERDVEVNCSCGRTHEPNRPWKNYLINPLLHALKVAAFIFLVNFVLTAIIHSVGEERFAEFLMNSRFVQPFIATAVGLIPNCASSVVLTETFLSGGITFGSMIAGLCANAGMGFVVLLKNTRQWKRNLLLVAFSYTVSVVIGLVLNIYPLMA